MNSSSILTKIKALHLPESEFVVVGSGTLAVKGIRDSKDIDIIVTQKLWEALTKEHATFYEREVERISLSEGVEVLNPRDSLYGNSTVVPCSEIFAMADVVEGVKFVNLHHLKKIKVSMGREKDLRDVALIDSYLKK